ncbi:MAG: hypothetical protein ABJB22_02725 [Verrucomicrobiota bacterium]
MFDLAPGRVSGATQPSAPAKRLEFWLPVALAVAAALVFYVSTKATQLHFDYTYRIAGALLKGHLGLLHSPPTWLNEMIPLEGEYYSVFPLGAVLTLIPIVLLRKVWLIHEFPGLALAAVIAGGCVYFFFGLSGLANNSLGRRILLALFPVFGTWTWCNLGFGAAWQIALGFALLGETAALYFTLVRPRPLLAGICFALAFGNRTEVILTIPIFIYFWFFHGSAHAQSEMRDTAASQPRDWRTLLRFLAIPMLLGIATAAYNFARFHSILDFGYARIPGVLGEPWYRSGLFSLSAMPWNAYKMLLEGMQSINQFPYFRPYPFGCSIFISSPFLFLLFREGGRFRKICWIAIGTLTLFLWCHGNPGGWQFSYRYGMVLLPWMFLLLVGNGPRKISIPELTLFLASIAVNAVAVHQFLWINEIKP